MNYLVTVMYDPGTPKGYLVRHAQDHLTAKEAVLKNLGYDPGVLFRVREEGAKGAQVAGVIYNNVIDLRSPNTADYVVHGGGSIFLVESRSTDALENLQRNVQEGAQWLGENLAVECRYIVDLLNRLRREGWVVR